MVNNYLSNQSNSDCEVLGVHKSDQDICVDELAKKETDFFNAIHKEFQGANVIQYNIINDLARDLLLEEDCKKQDIEIKEKSGEMRGLTKEKINFLEKRLTQLKLLLPSYAQIDGGLILSLLHSDGKISNFLRYHDDIDISILDSDITRFQNHLHNNGYSMYVVGPKETIQKNAQIYGLQSFDLQVPNQRWCLPITDNDNYNFVNTLGKEYGLVALPNISYNNHNPDVTSQKVDFDIHINYLNDSKDEVYIDDDVTISLKDYQKTNTVDGLPVSGIVRFAYHKLITGGLKMRQKDIDDLMFLSHRLSENEKKIIKGLINQKIIKMKDKVKESSEAFFSTLRNNFPRSTLSQLEEMLGKEIDNKFLDGLKDKLSGIGINSNDINIIIEGIKKCNELPIEKRDELFDSLINNKSWLFVSLMDQFFVLEGSIYKSVNLLNKYILGVAY